MKCLSSLTMVLMTLIATAPARADNPIWAEAKWVKANATDCGGTRFIVLIAKDLKAPIPAAEPGCTTTLETFHKIFVAKSLFKPARPGQLAASNVAAGFLFCAKDEAALLLGSEGDIERAMRQHPAPKGCNFSRRKYQYVSSIGSIAFSNVANGGTMTVAESLALHAEERKRIIAECNASPACRAQMQRANSRGKTIYTCPAGYHLGGMIDNPFATCVLN